MSGNAILKELVTASKAGRPAGICSVCSANEYVIEAAMEETLVSGGVCLIEATANQVNQFGGYTGMTPADFVSFCRKIASRTGLDEERLIFGGDHLGPLVWSAEEEEAAMEKAEALAVIDIDNFKKINDEYGHLAGDAVLRHVANVILSRVNTADTLVRYGGDEFVLLLSHIPPEKFRSILERIRGAVYTTEIPQYENIHPTVSIGGVYQAHPLVEAIRRADKLMYWAKQKRNDVQT